MHIVLKIHELVFLISGLFFLPIHKECTRILHVVVLINTTTSRYSVDMNNSFHIEKHYHYWFESPSVLSFCLGELESNHYILGHMQKIMIHHKLLHSLRSHYYYQIVFEAVCTNVWSSFCKYHL